MSIQVASYDDEVSSSVGFHCRTNRPFLRRFGRAVTGNQRLADLYVVQLMEDIVDRPSLVFNCTDVRVALYKHLCELMQEDAAEAAKACDAQVAVFISPKARQAQLLMRIEHFTTSEAALILGIEELQLCQMLLSLSAEGTAARPARILVIEDEPLISLQLEQIVLQIGHDLIGTAATRNQVKKLLKTHMPDLVLSDVHLADGSSGIDAVGDILAIRQIPVVYITAFQERLLTGRRTEPLFLISKPFDAEAVKATIGQALYLDSRRVD